MSENKWVTGVNYPYLYGAPFHSIYALPKTNKSPPKIDGWNTSLSFPFGAQLPFSGAYLLLVSGRVTDFPGLTFLIRMIREKPKGFRFWDPNLKSKLWSLILDIRGDSLAIRRSLKIAV